MIKNSTKTPIALAVSAALATSLAAAPMTHAVSTSAGSPLLDASTLAGGYMQVANAKSGEGKCGEAKCGDAKAEKAKEGKCGEAKCGDAKAEKGEEGKCGEGKCGNA